MKSVKSKKHTFRSTSLKEINSLMKNAFLIIILLFSFVVVKSQTWVQIGDDILGSGQWDASGSSVGLDSLGEIVVNGAAGNTDITLSGGKLRAFEFDGLSWAQKGADMEGTRYVGALGRSIDISSDGLTIIGGAPGCYGPCGDAKVYNWTGSDWIQKGQTLNQHKGAEFGTSVSISSSGNLVAIGAPGYGHDLSGFSTSREGLARVYEWKDTMWVVRGQDIFGEDKYMEIGEKVSLSNDGSILAVRGAGNYLKVYYWADSVWSSFSSTFGDLASSEIKLSGDGNSLVIGRTISNSTRIYERVDTAWQQKGDDIPEGYGYAVGVNYDGSVIALGNPSSNDQGEVKVYMWDNDEWILLGNILMGDNLEDQFGHSVDLNSTGDKLAVGAPGIDTLGGLKVFQFCMPVYEYIDTSVCISYLSPSGQYVWTESGNYSDTLQTISGCDSIIQINLTIKEPSTSEIVISACEEYTSPSGIYTWTESGLYADTILNAVGCDSVLFIDLTIFSPSVSTIDTSVCISYLSPSGQYVWTESGSYFDTLQTISGCDSIIQINLTIKEPSTSEIVISTCEEYTSPSGIYTWTESGLYADTITNYIGCDSIIMIDLHLYTLTSSNIDVSVCEEYISPSGNYVWTESGNYSDTIPNKNGCDSVIFISLTVNQPSFRGISITSCQEYLSPSGQFVWTQSGNYVDTIQNASGCDSVIFIDLTINYPSNSEIDVMDCEEYYSPSGKYLWTESGQYSDTLINANGCDSIISINLIINKSSENSITVTSCNSYTSPSGNYIWQNSGFYTDTIANHAGCDSILDINLTVIQLEAEIIEIEDALLCNITGGYYKWIDCSNGEVIIEGEDRQSFIPSQGGSYAVYVEKTDCSDTSDCFIYSTTNTVHNTQDYISVYPNPVNDHLILITSYQSIEIEIIGIDGIKILETREKEIDVSILSPGLYTVIIKNSKGTVLDKQVIVKR